MTDIVMALRLRIEDDEAPLYDHELHRHSLKAIQELRGKIQTVMEAHDRTRRENGELRGIIQQAADDVVAASYPRKMHLEWLEAARKVLAEDD
jgi:hypothetical protein